MAAINWIEPGMARNKRVRFQLGNASNTVSYNQPQTQALEIGRNPSTYNPNNLPAVRPSALPAVQQAGGVPAANMNRGFNMGGGSPVISAARPVTPQLQIGYNPLEQITSEDVWRNMQGRNAGRFVGPMPQETPIQEPISQSTTATEPPGLGRNVGPKNMGAFGMKTTFGGAQPIDPSGGILGELYRGWSKDSGRYIPGIDQMWGKQPDANKWTEDADAAYKASRLGLGIHSNENDPAKIFGALPKQQSGRQNNYPTVEDTAPNFFANQKAEWDKNSTAPAAIPRMGSGGHGYMEWGGKKHYVDDVKSDISEENRLKNVAINEANERFANEQKMEEATKRFFKDQQQNQMNFDNSARFFAENPNAPGAAAFRMQIAQGRKIGEQINPEMSTADFMARYRDAESKRGMQNAQAGHYGALANMQNVTAGLLPRTTEANIGHIGAQDKLIGSQIAGAGIDMDIKRKALAGDPAALAMIGKTSRQDQAYMHAVEAANKLTDEEARNAALQNAWYAREGYTPRFTASIPESGSLWWKKPAQKASLTWEPPTKKQG